MVAIPILSGIYSDPTPDFRTNYPINLRPVPKPQGISNGYLKVNDGVTKRGSGPGITRGGIEWEGLCYRVMGDELVSIDAAGNVTTLGAVASGGTASMTYSFDQIAVTSGGNLYYWDGLTFTQVTDPDLGTALDVAWVDGYFVTTDGENIVVTDLTDPTQVNPTKYGSSEFDPDPVKRVLRLRNELYAVNRHSIETFQNVGGSGFPFQVIRGSQIHKGAIGTHGAVVYQDAIAFLGGGRNESPAVWVGLNGSASKISTLEIDELLTNYTEAQLESVLMEVQTEKSHSILMIHLPDVTLCYDAAVSASIGSPAWYKLNDGLTYDAPYSPRHFVWCYDAWQVGSSTNSNLGYVDPDTADVWGAEIAWQFGTPIVYNESRGGIFHELELVTLTGAVETGDKATIYTQYSLDGVEWSQKRYISAGKPGQRDQRMRWFRNGRMSDWRVQRFGGTSRSPVSVARLEARIEGLAW